MKERGILFSAPMVRALLDGTKTQTRRMVKDLPPWEITEIVPDAGGTGKWMPNGPAPCGRGMAAGHWRPCPYGQPGDRLWVRESYRFTDVFDIDSPARVGERCLDAGYIKPWAPIHYDADGARRDWHHTGTPPHDGEPQPGKGRPSIHMPRWASRILLEIIGVRVERLQDISEADADAEGTMPEPYACAPGYEQYSRAYRLGYRKLWENINGAGSWAANPWVWVVEFRRIES